MNKPIKFKELTADFELKNHKYSAQIKISTLFDECVSIDDLGDWTEYPQDKEKLLRALDKGYASVEIIVVEARCADLPDLEGSDSIGGVIVCNAKDVDDCVKDFSMVENALSNLVASYERELKSALDKVERLKAVS